MFLLGGGGVGGWIISLVKVTDSGAQCLDLNPSSAVGFGAHYLNLHFLHLENGDTNSIYFMELL